MALITCPECGAQISDKAAACPKCGAPRRQPAARPATTLTDAGLSRPSPPPAAEKKPAPTWAWVVGSSLLAVFVIALVAGNAGTDHNSDRLRKYLESVLKDASSAQYRNEREDSLSHHLCGEVNSKNSFGAYTGFKRFVAGPSRVALEGETVNFEGIWREMCSAPAFR